MRKLGGAAVAGVVMLLLAGCGSPATSALAEAPATASATPSATPSEAVTTSETPAASTERMTSGNPLPAVQELTGSEAITAALEDAPGEFRIYTNLTEDEGDEALNICESLIAGGAVNVNVYDIDDSTFVIDDAGACALLGAS